MGLKRVIASCALPSRRAPRSGRVSSACRTHRLHLRPREARGVVRGPSALLQGTFVGEQHDVTAGRGALGHGAGHRRSGLVSDPRGFQTPGSERRSLPTAPTGDSWAGARPGACSGGLGREGRCGPPRRGASRGGAARGPWAAWPWQRRRWHRAPAHVSGGLPRVPRPDAVSPRCQEGFESHLVPETTGEGRFLAGVPAEAREARRTLRPPVSASELSHRTGVA